MRRGTNPSRTCTIKRASEVAMPPSTPSNVPSQIALDLEALLHLRASAHGLELGSRGRALSMQAGGYHSRFRGRGLEFDEVRPYQAGDDSRDIDWRVTARRGKPHTKLYTEERERPVWLLVDLGASLFFGSQRCLKSALAAEACALIAWSAARAGDRVGGLVHGQHEWLAFSPKSRRRGVLALLQGLARLQPVTVPEPNSQTDSFNTSLHRATALIHPGSRVFILSDFQSLDASGERALKKLSRHNELINIHISDPIEAIPPPSGTYRMGKPGAIREIDTTNQKLRKDWQHIAQQRQDHLQDFSRSLRAPLIPISTAESPLNSLRRGLGHSPSAKRIDAKPSPA